LSGVETTKADLTAAHTAIREASAERLVLTATAQAAEAVSSKAEERLASMARVEADRREALAVSLRMESASLRSTLEDELRSMETTVADLQHQLARACREGARDEGISALPHSGMSLLVTKMGQLSNHGHSGGSSAVDEIATRLSVAERERDSLEQQRRTLSMQLRSVTDAQANERAAATARTEQMQRQLRRLEEEVSQPFDQHLPHQLFQKHSPHPGLMISLTWQLVL